MCITIRGARLGLGENVLLNAGLEGRKRGYTTCKSTTTESARRLITKLKETFSYLGRLAIGLS